MNGYTALLGTSFELTASLTHYSHRTNSGMSALVRPRVGERPKDKEQIAVRSSNGRFARRGLSRGRLSRRRFLSQRLSFGALLSSHFFTFLSPLQRAQVLRSPLLDDGMRWHISGALAA